MMSFSSSTVIPVLNLLQKRKLRGEKVMIHEAATGVDIHDFACTLETRIPGFSPDKLNKKYLAKCDNLQRIMQDHCRQRNYTFQVCSLAICNSSRHSAIFRPH